MQPVTRSEQDKMVPIDTSGASVEIELEDQKKEAKDEEQNTVVEEQSIEEPIQEEPTKQEPAELVEEQVSEEDASRENEEPEEGPSTKALRGYSKRQKRKMEKMLARLKDMEE